MLERGGGAIVNLLPIAGFRWTKPESAVAAAGGSATTTTIQTAAEFAPKGIRCNGLIPFALSPEGAGSEGFKADVAQAALYLCSEESRYINGQLINVDMSQASRVSVNM